MIAPISAKAVMLRKWPACKGDSRTIRTSLRRSFNVTSAARVSSVDVTPVAISDIDRIEQGATIMPIVGNEPLEIGAAMLSIAWLTLAKDLTSATLIRVSWANVTSAVFDMTR